MNILKILSGKQTIDDTGILVLLNDKDNSIQTYRVINGVPTICNSVLPVPTLEQIIKVSRGD
jgi:hypothetical protein